MKRQKTATIVILPYGDDNKPIWDKSKPIAIQMDPSIFKTMLELENITRGAHIVLGTTVYRRANLRPILDLSMDEVTYAIPVIEVPDPSKQGDRIDVDVNGKPMFTLIKGGKSDVKSAA